MAATEAPQPAETSTNDVSSAVGSKATKGGDVLVPPHIGQRRAGALAARNAARAKTLSLLESGGGDTEEAVRDTELEPAKDAAPDPDAAKTDDDGGDVDEQLEPAKDAAQAKAKTPDAPAVSDGLAKIQAAEKKAKERADKERSEIAKERESIAAQRAELEALREKASKYDSLKKSAPADVVSAFKELGIDLEYGAKTAWQHHLASKDPANPQHREAAARLQRDRGLDDELTTTKKELAELRERLDRREQTEKTQGEAHQYFGGMAKQIETAEAPLLKTAMAKNPQGTWKRLANITLELEKEHGERPDAADVIATYEKRRLDELDELGITPPTAAANDSQTPKKNHPPADKKQPAKTLGTDLSTPRVVQPRSAKSEREHRAETAALLEAGKLE